jgi:hypothetical protein
MDIPENKIPEQAFFKLFECIEVDKTRYQMARTGGIIHRCGFLFIGLDEERFTISVEKEEVGIIYRANKPAIIKLEDVLQRSEEPEISEASEEALEDIPEHFRPDL